MKIGNPLLALHYSAENTVRVYEYINNAFVLINTSNGYPNSGNPLPHNLMWHKSTGKLLYIQRSGSSATVYVGGTDASSPVGLTPLPISSSTGVAIKNVTVYDNEAFVTLPIENSTIYPGSYHINATATAARLSSYVITVSVRSNFENLAMSSDGNLGIFTRNDSTNVQLAGISGFNPTVPYPYSKSYREFTFNIGKTTSKVFFSYDGSLAIIGNVTNNLIEVYKVEVTYDADNFVTNMSLTKTIDIPSGLGILQNVISSPDKTTMAFVYLNAGVYTTYLFGKYGDYIFKLNDEFANFGADIHFTGDGLGIVDGTSKKMKRFDGSAWVTFDTAMANIVAGATSQTLSDHTQNQITLSKFYDDAISTFTANQPVDLRLFLLDSSAVFVRNQSDLSTLEPNIIRNGMWPSDGVSVSVTRAVGDERYFINTDTITQPVVDTPITARYALIYDKLTNKPMIFYDLAMNRLFPVGSRINIGYTDNHLVTYTE